MEIVQVDALPYSLKRNHRFCCWRYEERDKKPTKVPYNPRTGGRAQSTNPATFAPLDVALKALEIGKYDGLGVGIFGDLGAIDIDHCIDDNGELSPLAFDVMNMVQGYTEYSPRVTAALEFNSSVCNWMAEQINAVFQDDVKQKVFGDIKTIFAPVKEYLVGIFSSTWESIKQIFSGFIDFLFGVFTGDWSRAWDGVKEIFRGVWNGIIGLLEGAVNIIIKGVNWLISQLNKIHFEIPDWVPGIGGNSFGINIPPVNEIEIPRLARGAVIPPNREFLAVLGDQKQGTNIETPLPTMVQAFKQALSEMGMTRESTIVLEVDGQQFGKAVFRHYNSESRRVGATLISR